MSGIFDQLTPGGKLGIVECDVGMGAVVPSWFVMNDRSWVSVETVEGWNLVVGFFLLPLARELSMDISSKGMTG